jgi:hypothetical protein
LVDRISAMLQRDEDSRQVFIGKLQIEKPLQKLGIAGRIMSVI